MLVSASSIVRSAIERAESRASVLNSLEKSYGNVSQSKASKKQQSPATTAQHSVGSVHRQVQSVQLFLGSQHDRIRKSLQDSLIGKSIVLTNLKSQVDASKSAKRVKSALCKLMIQRASKSKLKRLSLCDPMIPPTAIDLSALNSMWSVYISKIISEAQSEAQLQARLVSAEVVGARVIVVENGMDKCKGKHKGLTGILSSVSKECFYISHEKMVVATYQPSSSAQLIDRTIGSVITVETKLTEERIARDSGRQTPVMVKSNNPVDRSMKEVEWVRVVVVRRILRATSVLALLLPPPPIGCTAKLKAVEGASGERDSVALEEGMGRICLLHGSKQMPFTTNAL